MRLGVTLDVFTVTVVNSYGITIPVNDDGYVIMKHGDKYKLKLSNQSSLRCNAEVRIDGNFMGSFRINGYGNIVIERPAQDEMDKKFTFYLSDSTEGKASGLFEGNDKSGLIEVIFEQEKEEVVYRDGGNMYTGFRSAPRSIPRGGVTRSGGDAPHLMSATRGATRSGGLAAGGTGLQGKSDQRFTNAENITLSGKKVTISLRLIGRQEDKKDYNAITPLPGVSATSVPPPVPF